MKDEVKGQKLEQQSKQSKGETSPATVHLTENVAYCVWRGEQVSGGEDGHLDDYYAILESHTIKVSNSKEGIKLTENVAYQVWTDKEVSIKEDGHMNGNNETENSYAILEASIIKDDSSTEDIQPTKNVAYQPCKGTQVSVCGDHFNNKGRDDGYAILESPKAKGINNSVIGHSKTYSNLDADEDYI